MLTDFVGVARDVAVVVLGEEVLQLQRALPGQDTSRWIFGDAF